MEIHGYDGWRLKRQSDGLFYDHFGVDGLVLEQEAHDSFNDIVNAIVKNLIWRKSDVFAFDDAVRVNTLELKKLINFFRSRKERERERERESDEFILNHEGDKNDSGVISLKDDLIIKVQNEMRDNWLINFVETIEMNVRKATIDMIRGVVKLINNSSLMNTLIFDGFVEVSNRRRDTGCLGDFGNVGTRPLKMEVKEWYEHVSPKVIRAQDGLVTADEKIQKKNDVKARSMLLMTLLNEHLMTVNQYKDAKSFFDAITTRFGGNDATRKTQKTLLKQMYENFSAQSTESLNSIFNRLQKIVSQLAVLGESIS
nr:hypothetical protein [Tanacetum cinerariifolium]